MTRTKAVHEQASRAARRGWIVAPAFLAGFLLAVPAAAQQLTNFGSASGVACPGGNVICNGSVNFLTTELFFEPETPFTSLKETLATWNEIEYLFDNPYFPVTGAACNDGSGAQAGNDQGYPTYCTPTAGVFGTAVRRPAFGVSHPVRSSQAGAATAVAGLPPLRVHPLNYNAPNGTEQRVLNPRYAGGPFDNTGVCYTLGASCTPTPSTIAVSKGTPRLAPTQTPEINYDVAFGRKLGFCQTNPEPVPLNAPFNTAFDSETLTACGSDPGEPGTASLAHNNTIPALCVTEVAAVLGGPSLAGYLCEDNLGLPWSGGPTASWYSTPAVPAADIPTAMRRQIPAGTIPGFATGAAYPIQASERLVDPGARGTIQPYNPVTGTGGLKKPSLRMAVVDAVPVDGTGVTPAYLYNSAGNLAARGQGTLLPSNENDYYGLYVSPAANGYSGVTAANYYARKQGARLEAARLGKSLFWDMQVGSDGVQSCGSCHAHAGADNRTRNQVNPNGADGIRGNPTDYTPNAFTFPPNHDLTVADFPFLKLRDPEVAGDPVCVRPITGDVTGVTFPDGDPPDHPRTTYTACDAANRISDTDDVASSMGVHFGRFSDIPPIGLATSFGPASSGVRALVRDLRSPNPADNIDPIPGFAGTPNADGSANQFRRVEPRNTPTIFLAAANFDNFWDGRARHDDNGGSVFGLADPQPHVFVNDPASATGGLTPTRQLIKFSSIASLAKGPALSKFEMSFDGRNWAKIGKKLLQAGVTPLANQLVDPADSLLGPYSNQGGSACTTLPAADRSPEGGPPTALGAGVPGLCITYAALIRHAYYPALHANATGHLLGCYTDGAPFHPNQCAGLDPIVILDAGGTLDATNTADPFDGYRLTPAAGAANPIDTNQFTQMEGNFSLFWGQSINAWANLLVPDDTPFDRFQDQNPDAAMGMGETGEPLLVLDLPSCANLPAGYTRDALHPGCFREVGNFKRDAYDAGDIVNFQNDATGHPRMTACLAQVTIAGTRTCTQRVPAGGTRQPGDPDPLLGVDIFFGSNVSLKNPNFRSARCGACHNAPNLTDNTTVFTHKAQLIDAFPEFERGNPVFEPLMEPLGKLRLISGFHLESEINGPGQDAIERKIVNESIVPAPVVTNNGNCTTASCSGYSFPDAITVNATATGYVIHADLGSGPVAGAGTPVPFTSFGGSFFDNGVYNIGVRPCVASQSGVTGACEDVGRGGNDAFGWPLSLAALLMKNLGGPGQQPGVPVAHFNPSADPSCAPYCATGGLWEDTGHDQQINPGQGDEQVNPLLPAHMAPFASRITVGDAHPQLDEACGPVGGCINTLSDVANAEGFPEFPFDPRAHMSEVINSAVATGDSTLGGPGANQQGTWPVVNRVSRFGSFKAPQIREVELTGPYFHNGGKLTLRQVVDFYVRGGDFPVTNSGHRDFNILNLNAELQSDLDENEKVALVDFLLELTDDRVAYERAPFDHPQVILPLDGTAPEADGVVNRDTMLSGCVAAGQFGPGQQACDGGMFLNVPAVGSGGTSARLPNFLGIAGMDPATNRPAQRLVGAAAFCGSNVTSQYCH